MKSCQSAAAALTVNGDGLIPDETTLVEVGVNNIEGTNEETKNREKAETEFLPRSGFIFLPGK
jgi:hypothetical protein